MDIVNQYLALMGGWKVLSIAALIGLDIILGIVLSAIKKEFAWSKIANFLQTDVLMMFGGWLLVGVFGVIEPQYQLAVVGTAAALDAKLFADCVIKLKGFGVIFKKDE